MNAPGMDLNASLLDSHYTEWRLLSEQPCNVLLEGTVGATDAVLRLLHPHIGKPIAQHDPPAVFDLPSGEARALVLRDAPALSRDDQRRLLAWMDGKGSRTQVIATASRPLFPLVAAGLFENALYYRLNILLMRVGAPFQPGVAE